MTDATTFYNKPAIRLRESLTNTDVVCVLSSTKSELVGAQHSWSDVWTGARVLAVGEVVYRSDGQIIRVHAEDVKRITTQPMSGRAVARPSVTGGLSPENYLSELWTDLDG